MSFPASLTARTVKGRFVTHPDGVAAKGFVRIVLDGFMQGPTDDLFVAPFDRVFKLIDGAFSTILPATNDPQWTSSFYRVYITTELKEPHDRFKGPLDETKTIKVQLTVPYDSNSPIDLADVINLPVSPPAGNYILLATKGQPNGVASLGSDGLVPAEQLPPGNGGNPTWTSITGKPSTFPPAAHVHPESDVTGLVSALAAKVDSPVQWSAISGKPDTFPGAGGGAAYVWDGTSYVESVSAVYIGPIDPLTLGTPEEGTIWYATDGASTGGGGGALTPGQRVTNVDQVGYLGASHQLSRTLNVGDAIPSELTGCVWDDTVLRVNAGHNNLVIDGWNINAGVDCYSANLTVMNCVIVPSAGTAFYGVLGRAGTLTVQDTTIIGAGTAGELGQAVSLDNGGILTVERCDLSGFQDAIGIQNGLISQVYVHDSALAGSFHSDGIQVFGGGTSGTTIEHSLIDITGPAGASTDGEHQNACIYTDAPTGPAIGLVINNCQLNGGVYEMMLSAGPQDVHVTNCDFGPVDSTGYGNVTADPGTQIVTWTNNHNAAHTLVPDPTA
jgi:hypothetical protein